MEWTYGWGKSSRKPVDVGDLKAWRLDRRLGADTGALALQMETPGIHFPHLKGNVCICKFPALIDQLIIYSLLTFAEFSAHIYISLICPREGSEMF